MRCAMRSTRNGADAMSLDMREKTTPGAPILQVSGLTIDFEVDRTWRTAVRDV